MSQQQQGFSNRKSSSIAVVTESKGRPIDLFGARFIAFRSNKQGGFLETKSMTYYLRLPKGLLEQQFEKHLFSLMHNNVEVAKGFKLEQVSNVLVALEGLESVSQDSKDIVSYLLHEAAAEGMRQSNLFTHHERNGQRAYDAREVAATIGIPVEELERTVHNPAFLQSLKEQQQAAERAKELLK